MNIQGTARMTINANIVQNGIQSLTKDGAGTLILSGSNSYTGGTVVDDGTLIVTSNTALKSGTSLIVGTGAGDLPGLLVAPVGSQFTPALPAGSIPIVAATIPVAAVPEPGAIGLLFAAFCSVAIYRCVRQRRRR